jgi:hypothetical protein
MAELVIVKLPVGSQQRNTINQSSIINHQPSINRTNERTNLNQHDPAIVIHTETLLDTILFHVLNNKWSQVVENCHGSKCLHTREEKKWSIRNEGGLFTRKSTHTMCTKDAPPKTTHDLHAVMSKVTCCCRIQKNMLCSRCLVDFQKIENPHEKRWAKLNSACSPKPRCLGQITSSKSP